MQSQTPLAEQFFKAEELYQKQLYLQAENGAKRELEMDFRFRAMLEAKDLTIKDLEEQIHKYDLRFDFKATCDECRRLVNS